MTKWAAVVLLFLAGAALAGCAGRGGTADDDRRGGFYGGISGGVVHP